jgi:hypothetical protein
VKVDSQFQRWRWTERRFAITLTDNAAARAFAAQLPLTLDMSELNGNEKHADLPKPLLTNANRPGTIRNGDLMLYGADTLIVFYLTFQSSYSYTRLGRVDDPSDLPQALGPRTVRVVFSKDQFRSRRSDVPRPFLQGCRKASQILQWSFGTRLVRTTTLKVRLRELRRDRLRRAPRALACLSEARAD